MQVEPLEVYARDTNYAVIKPPGRHFPGSVIQGDSLRHLCSLALNIARHAQVQNSDDEEFLADVERLVGVLVGRTLHYQDVLTRHGIRLPYSDPVTEADKVRLLPKDGP